MDLFDILHDLMNFLTSPIARVMLTPLVGVWMFFFAWCGSFSFMAGIAFLFRQWPTKFWVYFTIGCCLLWAIISGFVAFGALYNLAFWYDTPMGPPL